jgi:hypothetical protein
MTYSTGQLRDDISYARGRVSYHNAQVSKCYEDHDVLDAAFHEAAARIHTRFIRDLEALLVAIDLVKSIT